MIVQQSVSAQQKADMKALAKASRAKVSFSGPHGSPRLTITCKNFTGQYPSTIDGYHAAKATLEKLTPKQKESE